MGVSCERCGSDILQNDWYCNHCGKERPRCPDCGAEMDDTQCKSCGTVRQVPCSECGLMVDATASTCSDCGYDPIQEYEEKQQSAMKKYLVVGGVGVVAYFFISGIMPGPSIIGTALGALVGGPIVLIAGTGALNAKRKEEKAEDKTAGNVRKGRKQNKSKAWREKEKKEREAAMEAAAKGLDAVGSAADSWSDSGSSNSGTSSSTTSASLSSGTSSSPDTFELSGGVADAAIQKDLNCPSCGQRWRVANQGLRHKPQLDGATAMDELKATGSTKIQCGCCDRTEYIESWD